MRELLVFMAGMLFSVAIILFCIGCIAQGIELLAGAAGSLLYGILAFPRGA